MITIDSITEGKRRSRVYRMFFLLFIVVILLFSAQIAAAESSEITFLKKLEAYDIADISSYPGDALRVIGFGIIKFWLGWAILFILACNRFSMQSHFPIVMRSWLWYLAIQCCISLSFLLR